ncbi:MAG: FkbM family methyltransferase [Armatimonadia bacterium]
MRLLRKLLRGRVFVADLDQGFRMWLHTDDWVPSEMFFSGTWEDQNTRVVRRILESACAFVDVGANIGYYTLLASKVLKHGAVFAYEPMPSTFEWLERNIRLNKCRNVESFPIAVSDQVGETTIHLFASDSFASASQFQAWRSDTVESVRVPTTTLDSHLLPRLPRVPADMLMKVDAEGGEFAIFRGAEQLLKSVRPILMFELFPALADAAGWQPEQLLGHLKEYGYEFFIPQSDGTIRPLLYDDIPSPSIEGHIDVFAFRGDVEWHRKCLRECANESGAD